MIEELIDGYKVGLDDIRHVWVGRWEDEFVIEFRNKEGELTRLRLSQEAGEALGHLLRNAIPKTDEMVTSFFKIMMTMKAKEAPKMEWVAVKPDTAPIPAP